MLNEHILIKNALTGNKEAFKEIVEMNKRNIYSLSFNLLRNRQDAEDATQDVFIKAFNSLKGFKFDSKLSTWLYKITVNTCLNKRRNKAEMGLKFEDNLENFAIIGNTINGGNPFQSSESIEIKHKIELALNNLSERERTIFIMKYMNGLQFNEISEALDISVGAVKNMNFRAIQKLRNQLGFLKKDYCIEEKNEKM